MMNSEYRRDKMASLRFKTLMITMTMLELKIGSLIIMDSSLTENTEDAASELNEKTESRANELNDLIDELNVLMDENDKDVK